MYIGLIYDVFSNETYFVKNEDLNIVKELLLKSNLQLPTACIYDYSKNRFALLNDSYRRHIEELLTVIETNR